MKKKYSKNLNEMVAQVSNTQPVLVDMLEKYVLSEGDKFFSNYVGESDCGQVFTKRDVCLYLYKDRLSLLADASIVGVIANSIDEGNRHYCIVKINTVATGCSDYTSLSMEASW